MLPMIMKADCMNWCADQFFHANNQSYWFIVIALVALTVYGVVMKGWERLNIKEETAERICSFCITISVLMCAGFLLYTFFLYEPQYVDNFLQNVTPLTSNISTGLTGG